jgi:hypothetical protein
MYIPLKSTINDAEMYSTKQLEKQHCGLSDTRTVGRVTAKREFGLTFLAADFWKYRSNWKKEKFDLLISLAFFSFA